MAVIEKNIRKVMPDALQAVFTPFFTMAITIPISLLALAPLGNLVGNAIGNLLFSVADLGPFGILIVMAILGAFWQLFVVAGMHMPIIMLAIVQITQVGYDPYIFVSTNCAMFAVWGVTIGAFLRIKNKEERGLIAGHFIAAALGGVTEPALFGIIMRWKRTMLGMFAGGALGAVVSGILGVVSYMAGGGTNFMIVLNYLQGGQENVIKALIGIVISIVVAAVVTFLFGFSKEDLEKING
jgi:PTS system beta-glucosides-specific IIC component